MDEGLSDFCVKAGVKCGRWNPTAEQVKVLTDLFRAGLRTPSAEQIQKISTQLSFYGKIESKNVFYWFQNHKARDRQKRRRISIDKQDLEREEKQKSANSGFAESVRVFSANTESERTMKTLQLFPLKSYEESEAEFRLMRKGTKEPPFSPSIRDSFYSRNKDPLDLCLSS